jgi:hypothetical protein
MFYPSPIIVQMLTRLGIHSMSIPQWCIAQIINSMFPSLRGGDELTDDGDYSIYEHPSMAPPTIRMSSFLLPFLIIPLIKVCVCVSV